ncbi:amino acid permease [Streptomyces sp. TRM76323]|uniref:Amino acid permease n=1 Tax=Streptomyces tamarix TaxID=3078565 RepID=A0ABU3QJX3_9ACTN|nr:amino acid permease [Streptomyces tamarix]MDT9683063.1 amino acid permease [Streptomyces tamarix]
MTSQTDGPRTDTDVLGDEPVDATARAARTPDAELSAPLRQRHLTMIGLGGAIGSGLFVGSGAGIAVAGPGILISFVLAGLLSVLVMRMMGELSVALPSAGSFSSHAERAWGGWAGFTVGWLYWCMIVVVVAIEATGAAVIVHGWVPAVDTWAWVLLFMAVFTVANVVAVGTFGEFEFWFAALKVAAIVAFLVLGAAAVMGWLPGGKAIGLSHLTGHGGFLPHGWHGVLSGLLVVVFSFGGMEVVTFAAAETKDPARGLSRAMRSVVWRLMLFYVGSVTVIVTVLPWNDSRVGQSPFVAVLDRVGVPGAAQLMNVVLLVALLSALNANLYAASRMVYSLAERRAAPGVLGRLSRNGVPRLAVLASVAFGFVSVLLNFQWPDSVFLWMLNSVGAIALVVWMAVAATQLRLRAVLERTAPERLTVRVWGYPALTVLALLAMGIVLVLLAADRGTRPQVVGTGILTAVVLAVGVLRQRRRSASRAD